jgi:hypothetical protein
MRAKTKQAKNVKNHAKSERGRYIYKEFMALGLEIRRPADVDSQDKQYPGTS